MTSSYENASCGNIFQQLDDECSVYILGLCLASNDLILHHRLISEGQKEEGVYHFAASLSILRETAKILKEIDKSSLSVHFSQATRGVFENITKQLLPFKTATLTGGTLKPIRDLTFHYVLPKASPDNKIQSLFIELRSESTLPVRATSGDNSVLRYRYTFADVFRSKLVESYLTKHAKITVDQISAAVVQVIAFTDSLLADLSQAQAK